MKILITMYNINNPGGIINHNENLIAGLQQIGHEVDFVELVWRTSVKGKKTTDQNEYMTGASGIPVHQGKGWLFPQSKRYPYKGDWNITRWQRFANEFDLIIWQIPVPTKQRDNTGNMDWVHLYELDSSVKQLAIIHDGNMQKSYPWISHISQHLTGLACVHPCAYHGAAVLDVPRALILNPQDISTASPSIDWEQRRKGFISLQTFKGWKHVDDLVRSIPHMDINTKKILAGGGIEYNYMTSKEKCKPNYFITPENDADIHPNYYGEKIWDAALDHQMDWLGYISETTAQKYMQKLRCIIDPSWSVAYAKIGDHFNRVVVDGIIQGLIPIARDLGISTNTDGEGEVFKPNENYMMVPHDAKPKEFAEIVESTLNLPEDIAAEVHFNNYKLLQHFDRERVAYEYIDLATNLPAGWYQKLETGTLTESVKQKTDTIISTFFKEA